MAQFYQVGGSVRDHLLGIGSKDIDYAVEADSFDAMRDAVLSRGGKIFLETPQFFTIRANVPGLGSCDYVLCRKEGQYKDGRHPTEVSVGTIYDDLARRDFTVNAMALTETGELLDPHGGQQHLRERTLSCVGVASERFTEDGLRMLRAIRFAITKDFLIDDDIVDCLRSPLFFVPRLMGVSQERIREELVKCFAHNTNATLNMLGLFPGLRHHLFRDTGLWLKPTMEKV